ncbi:MAG: putative glycolipid-binding domain-containing protein [Thermoleophilaceae bacterium]
MAPMPQVAAWQHRDARAGFEVAFFDAKGRTRVSGTTAAVEEGQAFVVRYEITPDERWRTRSTIVVGQAYGSSQRATIEADGEGHWTVDGEAAPHLDGCLDLDLESSALTNAFPMLRLKLQRGEAAEAPAAYVRALDLAVERLEQRYGRLDDAGGCERYDYHASTFDFWSEIRYDAAGLVVDYPGIALRAL